MSRTVYSLENSIAVVDDISNGAARIARATRRSYRNSSSDRANTSECYSVACKEPSCKPSTYNEPISITVDSDSTKAIHGYLCKLRRASGRNMGCDSSRDTVADAAVEERRVPSRDYIEMVARKEVRSNKGSEIAIDLEDEVIMADKVTDSTCHTSAT